MAVAGLVDFSKARFRDSTWFRQLRWRYESHRRQQSIAVLHLDVLYLSAMVQVPGFSTDTYNNYLKQFDERYHRLRALCAGDSPGSADVRQANELQSAKQEWIDAFGVDPSDEKFKAWEREQVKKLLAG